ncbi:hypothetical protein ISG33_04040 [Glaciecola sp. MH2013]|uniref:biotin/lipoyl-containing protein n=1 Tax=Glaciecola sp. MH2013 TaxID=2785524 RepID=UPI0018A1201F|nr:biotin/lipoyl-containing protein [Glaciecola sp. MH2013]MBF7072567.1 hypothetical protein [Glaciecola sp. MH2013]
MMEMTVPLLPDESEKVEVIAIHCSEGDRVDHHQCILDIETDKVVLEIFAPADGVIHSINVNVGDKLAQESLLCVLKSDKDTYQEDVDHIQAMFEADLGEKRAGDEKSGKADVLNMSSVASLNAQSSAQLNAQPKAEPNAEPNTEQNTEQNAQVNAPIAQTPATENIEATVRPEQAKAEQAEVEQAEVEPVEVEPVELEPVEVEPVEVEQVEVEQVETEQATEEQLRPEQSKLERALLERSKQEQTSSQQAPFSEPETETEIEHFIGDDAEATHAQVNHTESPKQNSNENKVSLQVEDESNSGFTIFISVLVVLGAAAFSIQYFKLWPVIQEFLERFI